MRGDTSIQVEILSALAPTIVGRELAPATAHQNWSIPGQLEGLPRRPLLLGLESIPSRATGLLPARRWSLPGRRRRCSETSTQLAGQRRSKGPRLWGFPPGAQRASSFPGRPTMCHRIPSLCPGSRRWEPHPVKPTRVCMGSRWRARCL